MKNLEYMAVFRLLHQKISVFTCINTCGSYNLLTDRIDRRVCYLGKQLFKVIKQRAMLFGKHCQRCIHSHGSDTLCPVQCHVADRGTILFVSISKCLLKTCSVLRCVFLHTDIRDLDIFKLYEVAVQPLTIRLHFGIFFFQFIIIDNFPLDGIHQEHFSRMQTLFENDFFLRNRHNTNF